MEMLKSDAELLTKLLGIKEPVTPSSQGVNSDPSGAQDYSLYVPFPSDRMPYYRYILKESTPGYAEEIPTYTVPIIERVYDEYGNLKKEQVIGTKKVDTSPKSNK